MRCFSEGGIKWNITLLLSCQAGNEEDKAIRCLILTLPFAFSLGCPLYLQYLCTLKVDRLIG